MLEHYNFFSLELRDPNLFQHYNAPVLKACSMKTPVLGQVTLMNQPTILVHNITLSLMDNSKNSSLTQKWDA